MKYVLSGILAGCMALSGSYGSTHQLSQQQDYENLQNAQAVLGDLQEIAQIARRAVQEAVNNNRVLFEYGSRMDSINQVLNRNIADFAFANRENFTGLLLRTVQRTAEEALSLIMRLDTRLMEDDELLLSSSDLEQIHRAFATFQNAAGNAAQDVADLIA